MKKLWFLFWVSFTCVAEAQPSIKLYAYSRETTQGTVRRNPNNENGNPVISSREPLQNYYVFAVYKGSSPVRIASLWIKGKRYQVQVEKTDSTPVILSTGGPGINTSKEILVPATKSNVISIVPLGKPMDEHILNSIPASRRHSAIIVSYYYRGKLYYAGLKKIKSLLPAPGV